MVTLQKMANSYNRNVLEIVGKSTDTKPTNSTGGIESQAITNGSTYLEMDTVKLFMFDYEGDTWFEL